MSTITIEHIKKNLFKNSNCNRMRLKQDWYLFLQDDNSYLEFINNNKDNRYCKFILKELEKGIPYSNIELNDDTIINLFFDNQKRFKSSWKRVVRYKNISEYLLNRFEDNTDYKDILSHIAFGDKYKICKFCGKEFFDRHNTKEFCSKDCKFEYFRINKPPKEVLEKQKKEKPKKPPKDPDWAKKRKERLKAKREANPEWWAEVQRKKKESLAKHEAEDPGFIQRSKDKAIQTARERNSYQKGIAKRVETCKQLYGDDYASQFAKIASQTYFEKHGIYTTQLDIMKERSKQTKKERYGDENYNNREQAIQTCNERYGTNTPAQVPEIQAKMEQTCTERYGVRNYSQTVKFRQKARKKYLYKNTFFDSSWELALWIYAKDHNEKIEREPCSFDYLVEGKIHKYFPDFKYKNNIVEIKGDQFFNDDGSFTGGDEKYQCMIDNNVLIWKSDEVKPFLDYVTSTYGKDYLSSFLVEEVEDIL